MQARSLQRRAWPVLDDLLLLVAASVRRAQAQGFAADLDPEHTAAAIALLFENFTTVFAGDTGASIGVTMGDDEAIATLSRIWKKTLYGH